MNRTIGAIVGAAALAGLIAGCGSSGTGAGSAYAPNAAQSRAQAQAVASANSPATVTDPNGEQCASLDSSGYCPGDDPTPSAPPPPQYTASQQQAIDAAENYLTDGQGFSQAGLIQQLTSQYGNGFSMADATFAVQHVWTPGLWDAQAADSAKNYMSDGQGFSCSSLLQQLTSQYGSQFTQAQGEYGVQSVGLGTC